MRGKSKIVWIGAGCAVAGLLVWLCFAAVIATEGREIHQHFATVVDPYNAFARKLQTDGLPADLPEQLSGLPKDKAVTGFALVDSDTRQVVVGETAGAAGKPLAEIGLSYYRDDIRTPDGHSYWLVAFLSNEAVGYSRRTHLGFGWAGSLFTAAAWLSFALWLFTDARQRAPRTALAWGFLGLVTGPIGLAVYRVVRPVAEICPGCGEILEPGGPFCPSCGYALRPNCPDCHQPVQIAWRHCRSCGADLQAET